MKSNYSLALIVAAGSMLINTAPLQASDVDANINHEIFDLLLANNSLAPTTVKFASQDGVVTISGTTRDLAHKEQLDSVVGKLPGVVSVIDNRTTDTIAQNAPKSAATNQKIDDTSLTDEVKSALMFHNSTSDTITQIVTKDGVVTITGVAKSEAEKSRTTQLAAAISGVKSVINNMTIAVPMAAN
jgi:hyperosmotically inducible periplasmic protein